MSENSKAAFDAHHEFLEALEVTPMSRSYKILVLIAMLARNVFPGRISINELAAGIEQFARRSHLLVADFGPDLKDRTRLMTLLKKSPIQAWVDGLGMQEKRYFDFANDVFSTRLGEAVEHREELANLTRELCDYRLAQYLERLHGETRFAARILCNVSHTNGRPMLFLPDRDSTPGIPDGWQSITADGKRYAANFVKIAVNVVVEPGQSENVLPAILRAWFGDGAGQPGKGERVIFEWREDGYQLKPLTAEAAGPELWHEYARADIAPLWGLEFSRSRWHQGFVRIGQHVFLLVSLDKAGLQDQHRYDDGFLAPDLFRWVSQNKHARDGAIGKMLKRHAQQGVQIHLFVRATRKTPRGTGAPFTYCGDVGFVDWEGSKPIKISWRLNAPVPEYLRSRFSIPDGS